MTTTISISPSTDFPADVIKVRGACPHDCPDTCALLTTVENGVAVKVQGNPEHRQTGGVLCTKVSGQACQPTPMTAHSGVSNCGFQV